MSKVREVITGMSDDELKEMIEEKYLDYTREALNIGQEELIKRGISFVDKSICFPSGEDDPVLIGEKCHPWL